MVLGPSTLSVKTFAVCTGILYVKFLSSTMVQGGKKFASGGRPPEDVKLSLARGRKQNYGLVTADPADEKLAKAREVEHRWTRIIANDLESMPFALFTFGSGLLVEANEPALVGAMIVYTAARCAHTYAYAHELQPHRGLFWAVGVLSILVGVGNAVLTALTN